MVKKLFKVVRNSSLIKASGIYTISSFINASIPFLLLPILTTQLSRVDFGIISMFTSVTGFMMPFVGINLEGAIARRYYSDSKKIATYVGNCLSIAFLSFLVVSVISFLFRNQFSQLSGITPLWISLASLFCFCQFICLVLLTLYQVEIKPVKYGIVQIAQSLLNFFLTAILILSLGMNWEGRLIAMVCSAVLFSIIAIIILVKNGRVKFDINISYIQHALRFGGGLIPHALGASLMTLTNRFFLLKMLNIEESGLYG